MKPSDVGVENAEAARDDGLVEVDPGPEVGVGGCSHCGQASGNSEGALV